MNFLGEKTLYYWGTYFFSRNPPAISQLSPSSSVLLLFFINQYCFDHLKSVFIVSLLVSAGLYIPFAKGAEFNMYGSTYYKWFHYFIFMLEGAICGVWSQKNMVKAKSGCMEVLKALICIVVFYGLCAFKSIGDLNYVQVLSLLPLLGAVYYIYRWCNSERIKKIYNDTCIGYCMNAIGGLCLEVYLVQYNLFTDKLNFLFPLNIPIIFLEILVFAYILRCMGRIWAQTFKEADYEWKEVFRLV